MKRLFVILTFAFNSSAFAWDFNARADLLRSSTDNVNLENTTPTTDSYSTLSGYLQTKNNNLKIKLKGKVEKFNKQSENDNYLFDLSTQYKYTQNNDFTFALFKQVYNGIPQVSTDTTSDNTGARISSTFSSDFTKETSGYLILNGTYKNYSKFANRKDKTLGTSFGLEHYLNSNFLINPEFIVAYNLSSDTYYKNSFYGPSLLLSYTPNDELELFIDASYSRSNYPDRTITSVVRRKTVTDTEYQKLFSTDMGAIYTVAKYFPIQLKYSTSKNTSNNPTSAYSAKIISIGVGVKY